MAGFLDSLPILFQRVGSCSVDLTGRPQNALGRLRPFLEYLLCLRSLHYLLSLLHTQKKVIMLIFGFLSNSHHNATSQRMSIQKTTPEARRRQRRSEISRPPTPGSQEGFPSLHCPGEGTEGSQEPIWGAKMGVVQTMLDFLSFRHPRRNPN